ncbi:MAG: hypothetical protein KJ970_19420 [Candidatus Eisenbacteria bacterium]|uniref:Uncharacterized protein n=1 Tax=Eiseniibacteriota bacterium TaxID=2212470 RepID=A0A948S0L3_UNCEI|nr:hypothetical protein [Candidatus Eisenbacteria bacterium]MBU1947479.1 hypothetical protein [Candidatus Eisenbacteria bacterium]MBU2693092.1 hypothetical protein [Candidatus Eisenbacteria bacterium]
MGQGEIFDPNEEVNPPHPTGDNQNLAGDFNQAVENLTSMRKVIANLEKLCHKLGSPEIWAQPSRCREAVDQLAEITPQIQNLPILPDGLLQRARDASRQVEHALLKRTIDGLEEACRTAGVSFQCISRPSHEYRTGTFTLVMDPASGRVRIGYARELMVETPMETGIIWNELHRCIQELKKGFRDSEFFFKELLAVYKGMLGEKGRKFGERVELADLPGRLTARRLSRSFWKNPRPGAFHPITRAMLAYGLDQLILNRALGQDGFRLRLGSATMDTTKKKADVLYLEKGQAGGQYYLTFWFEKDPGAKAEG